MEKKNGSPTAEDASSVNCFNCQWRNRSQWCVLEGDDLGYLHEQKQCSAYKPGQVVIRQGDPCEGVYCVEMGTVALRKTDEHGNSALVRLCHAGDTIGYRDFFQDAPSGTTAEVLSASRLCFVGREAVHKLLSHNPALGLTFLKRLAQDLDDAEQTILQAGSFSVRTRLAHLLLALRERYGTVNDQGVMTIALPLARRDIASILGSRPETIARTIHALEVDNVVRFSGRNVIVDDLDLLLDEIEPEGDL